MARMTLEEVLETRRRRDRQRVRRALAALVGLTESIAPSAPAQQPWAPLPSEDDDVRIAKAEAKRERRRQRNLKMAAD